MRIVRVASVLAVLFLALSLTAFGQLIDPNVMFCAPTVTPPCGGDPNLIPGNTSVTMFSNGAPDATSPWFLLIAVPQGTSTPSVTGGGFTFQFLASASFLPTSSGDIYDLFSLATGQNGSMNATNMFGTAEQIAFGGKPTSFTVYEFSATPGFDGQVSYLLTTNALPAGTFFAASAFGPPGCVPTATSGPNQCNQGFSTPFTTTGLFIGNTPEENFPVPEPASLTLLGAGLLGVAAFVRRKLKG